MKKTVLAALMVFVLCYAGAAFAQGKVMGHVCDTKFVEEKIGNPGWVILDGRGMEDYLKGHIPGAVNYGKAVVVTLKHPVDGRVVSVPEAERLLGQIGLSNDKGLIIYGTKGDYHVTVEQLPLFLGVKEYYYLNGGYEAWVEEVGKVEAGINTPKPAVFKAKVAMPNLYVSTEEMKKIVEKKSPNTFLIDVRSVKEFEGEENSILRGGRIPGAINIPQDKNLDPKTGKILPLDKLASVYKDIPKDAQVIIYCHRGCRTGFTYYALENLGYKNLRIYEDSYVVWGSLPDTPVEHEHYINLRPIAGYGNAIKALTERINKLEQRLEKLGKN